MLRLRNRGKMKDIETALINLGRAVAEFVTAVSKLFDTLCKKLPFGMAIYFAPKSKVKHLALHAKKARVRKKNIKRLLKGGAE